LLIDSAPHLGSAEEAAFWSSLGVAATAAVSRLAATTVCVQACGATADDARALGDALTALRIRTTDAAGASLTIAVVHDYLQPELAALNQRMRDAGRPWMLLKPIGGIIWIGPIFDHAGPCWRCLSRRIGENRPDEIIALQSAGQPAFTSRAALPASRAMAVQLAATEVAKWAGTGGEYDALTATVATFDLATLTSRRHAVRRRPHCDVCAAADVDAAPVVGGHEPIVLQRVPKRFTADGGHRAHPPEDTLARLLPFVSPITGIIPELAKDPACQGLHVYSAKQAWAIGPFGPSEVRFGKRVGAAGKGFTEVQAQVSCAAEAIERYNFGFTGHEPRVTARYDELNGRAIHPEALLHFSERQYATREEWNRRHERFDAVPVRFDPSRPIEWTPAWSLTHGDTRWLPTAFCYYEYPIAREEAFCIADSNGCAAGNNREEAILQGLLELVERDATAMWWYCRVPRPAVDIASFRDAGFDAMVEFYRRQGRTLVAQDLTTDLGIPTICAVSWDGHGGRILFGLGAHLDPRIAMSRAITEIAQMMPVLPQADARDDAGRLAPSERQSIRWIREATCENQPYVVPAAAIVRSAEDLPSLAADDLRDDVATVVDIVGRRGMEVIVLDATRSDIDLCTVRVTVPGLRHFWARFAPGRLYDVPVAQGWLSAPRDESALNPIPFFL
jgi:ribosomal protein S12 methylthiotransferase accessory factor